MAILDHSLPLQVKAPDMMGMLDQGSQLAQFYTQNKADGELNRLYKETNGDLNKMLEIGKTSPLARFVMPQLQAQQAAQQKAALDQQKTLSDIGKTQSETSQNNATTQGKKLSNAQTLLTSANQALYVATQSGDANAVKLALNNAKTAGLLDEATYNQYFATAEGLSTNPEGLKSFALNLQKAYAQNPEKYNFTTADNVLDNQTSADNNIRTNQTSENNSIRTAETSRYSTDVNAQTAANKLSFEEAKNEQEQKKGTVLQWGDTMYMVYPDNSVKEVASPTGQPITKSNTTIKTSIAEEQQRTQKVSVTLDAVEGLLDDATGSGIGRLVDGGARIFGVATPGDIATAKLGTLGGQLVALMPKMSGPQSDKDVEMYKQMAGKLDDPSIPVEIRKAALGTIRELNNKYSEMNEARGQGVPYANASSNTQTLSGAQSKGFQSLIEKHTK
ncbi:hypothetical protein [uncultured Acinetobacter sp.]|uniref:hypothetical protein n=1 Tax=uncultured Acinetobacter sp. TaxID=165433 RepID=UPI0025F31533|nr:hypothetical protein [uncultured Acinetobacter sp.]